MQACNVIGPVLKGGKPGIGKLVTWDDLPGWRQDNQAEAWPALLKQCERLKKKQNQWKVICADASKLAQPDNLQARDFFETWFEPHRVTGKYWRKNGLITGYFEPLLFGSFKKTNRYLYPVYKRPDNLLKVDLSALYPELKGKRVRGRVEGNKVLPFFSREQIDSAESPLEGNEILWVDDRDALFFLHIQGSGRVRFEDGSIRGVGYADQNGHPYVAIGRTLIDMGELQRGEVTMFSIREWLRENSARAEALLNKNPSYVFFVLRDKVADGPIGSLNVPLTAGRSIAVDRKVLALGAPVWLDTELPNDGGAYQRLMFAQDTGGAITGPVRADVFFGHGERAEQLAGNMKQQGRLYALIPREELEAE